jgi:hypothetical protein
MLRRVALVITDVSEERSASIIRVTRIGELGKTLGILRSMRRLLVTDNVPSSLILVTLMMETLSSSETSVLARSARGNISGDVILHTNYKFSVNPITILKPVYSRSMHVTLFFV